MKKSLSIILFLMLLSLSATAQVKIGLFSYDAALKSMPEYDKAQQELAMLREQYDAETRRSEEDFSAKYEDFLENLSTYATSIRRKRQTELQMMMEANLQFRKEAQRLLEQAEQYALVPVRQKLDAALRNVAATGGYQIILNTDANACPFIDPSFSEDITEIVKEELTK